MHPARADVPDGTIRLGRFVLAAQIANPGDADAVALIFRQPARSRHIDGARDGTLMIEDAEGGIAWPAIPADGLIVEAGPTKLTLTSDLLLARFERARAAFQLHILVRRRDVPADEFRVHLSVVFHRVLLALGCMYLHAAAVSFKGRTRLFVGEKGAGKSTLSLVLARAGGCVLADDHIVVERAIPAYFASGCESTSRITAETEAYVFDRPLQIAAQDFAGTMKKEFELSSQVAAEPYVPHAVGALYFPRVGAQLRVTPRTPQHTILELIERTRPSFRPQHAGDVSLLLDFWSGLARAAPAYDLELPRDLRALGSLPDLLPA